MNGRLIRRRLDVELVRRKLADSRQEAQRQVRAGTVLVDGVAAHKPAHLVDANQELVVDGQPKRYVSRAGMKLEAGLDEFQLGVEGLRCLDAGSSTGGFSDCLLQRGVASVAAVDVGTDQLHKRVKNNPRVAVFEQTDIRSVSADLLGGRVDLAVGDLSFISLRLVLPVLAQLVADEGDLVVLVKPQFEAGRSSASKNRGIIRDPLVWRRVLGDIVDTASDHALGLRGATVSPITGASGNVEFILWLQRARSTNAVGIDDVRYKAFLDDAVARAESRGE